MVQLFKPKALTDLEYARVKVELDGAARLTGIVLNNLQVPGGATLVETAISDLDEAIGCLVAAKTLLAKNADLDHETS